MCHFKPRPSKCQQEGGKCFSDRKGPYPKGSILRTGPMVGYFSLPKYTDSSHLNQSGTVANVSQNTNAATHSYTQTWRVGTSSVDNDGTWNDAKATAVSFQQVQPWSHTLKWSDIVWIKPEFGWRRLEKDTVVRSVSQRSYEVETDSGLTFGRNG